MVAGVASKLFGSEIAESNVIGETLERITAPAATADSVTPHLGEAIDAGVLQDLSDAALRDHPLAVWWRRDSVSRSPRSTSGGSGRSP